MAAIRQADIGKDRTMGETDGQALEDVQLDLAALERKLERALLSHGKLEGRVLALEDWRTDVEDPEDLRARVNHLGLEQEAFSKRLREIEHRVNQALSALQHHSGMPA